MFQIKKKESKIIRVQDRIYGNNGQNKGICFENKSQRKICEYK